VQDTKNKKFYARCRVQGRLVWRSLETNNFTDAKARISDKLKEISEEVTSSKHTAMAEDRVRPASVHRMPLCTLPFRSTVPVSETQPALRSLSNMDSIGVIDGTQQRYQKASRAVH